MAAPQEGSGRHAAATATVVPETIITIKVAVNDQLKRLKLPLRDLGIGVLPSKLRQVLDIKPEQHMILERYSDSIGGYVTLDEDNLQVFKTLIRAAKAKLKLRLKITVTPADGSAEPSPTTAPAPASAPLIDIDSKQDQHVITTTNCSYGGIPLSKPRDVWAENFSTQFRDWIPRTSQQTLVKEETPALPTAPEPTPEPAVTRQTSLAFRSRPPPQSVIIGNNKAWTVYCNECDVAMDDAHFHCGICDGGDFDLCEACVAKGKTCPAEDHWLIKRFMKDGKVISGTTERVSSRRVSARQSVQTPAPPTAASIPTERDAKPEVHVTFSEPAKALALGMPTRTCNNCVKVNLEREFVTCNVCEDFDLCVKCHDDNTHGHHPAHALKPATAETQLSLNAQAKLNPGRNVRHDATCDGCDKNIYGVRHKCLNCPDWDYCSTCIQNARYTHPRHRFAALYEPIATPSNVNAVHHYGIYCNGPLCQNKLNQSYITGVRYKCTICHDTDFCAACEALPSNRHNRTHPLLKLRTPVRHVNIMTENEDMRGNVRVMGDRAKLPTEPAVARPASTATEVHTVADIQPTEVKKVGLQAVSQDQVPASQVASSNYSRLTANFVRDTVHDGTVFEPNTPFTQVWTLTNPGPFTWPSGCSVRYVGGDNMLNVDNNHPASNAVIAGAFETNIVGREVKPGEEVAFLIVLKSPARKGNHISYWRLKAPDGTPFGHRLWCDIKVEVDVKVVAAEAKPLPTIFPAAKSSEAGAAKWTQMTQDYQQRYVDLQKAMDDIARASAARLQDLTANAGSQTAQMMIDMRRKQAQLHRAIEVSQTAGQPMKSFVATPDGGVSVDREAAFRRAIELRAKILKAREEMEKVKTLPSLDLQMADLLAAQAVPAPDLMPCAIVEPNIAASSVQTSEDKAEDVSGSQMVFPTLAKESPVSSTYQSVMEGEVETTTGLSIAFPEDDLDLVSNDETDTETGFLTDDEYDILDASDRETVLSHDF